MCMNDNQVFEVRCPTNENADALFELLNAEGYVWATGKTLNELGTQWGRYNKDTVYEVTPGRKIIRYGMRDDSRQEYNLDEVFDMFMPFDPILEADYESFLVGL